MGCLTLPPLVECGFGTCVNGSCVCDQGVTQSIENLYVPLKDGEVVVCDTNIAALTFFYSALLALTVVTLSVQAYVIENRRQAKRLAPLLLGYPLLIVALSIRLARIEDPLWGVDFVYTFFLSVNILVQSWSFLVFINKYLGYLDNTIQLKGQYRLFSKISYKIDLLIAVLLTIGSALWIAPTMVDSLEASKALTIAGCSVYSVCFAFLTVSTLVLLNKYVSDLRTVIRDDVSVMGKDVSPFIKRCQRQLPKATFARNATVIASFSVFLTNFPVFLEGWLKQHQLIIYCAHFCYQIANLITIRSTSHKLHRLTSARGRGSSKDDGSKVSPVIESKTQMSSSRTESKPGENDL